jgi:hypothetical protein
VKCGQGKIILLRVLQMKIVDFISFILYLSFLLLVSDLDNGFAGYCTDVCCDQKTEETCYDYDGGTSNTHAQKVRRSVDKVRLFFLLLRIECHKLHFTNI